VDALDFAPSLAKPRDHVVEHVGQIADFTATGFAGAGKADCDGFTPITDPNGETAYYGHADTYQGGHVSRDITSGYGPEEFSLKRAKPGKYTVRAKFYGHRQQVVSGATTIQLEFFSGFGTPRQKQQGVTLRLKDAQDQVLVGEFVVDEPSPQPSPASGRGSLVAASTPSPSPPDTGERVGVRGRMSSTATPISIELLQVL